MKDQLKVWKSFKQGEKKTVRVARAHKGGKKVLVQKSFNPADLEYPVGLNPLQKTDRDRHHLVVGSIIATLKSIWGDVWGTGRMQYVMHHTLSALLFYDHPTAYGHNGRRCIRAKRPTKAMGPGVA